MVTNLVNSMLITAHEIIEMSMVLLDTYEDPPLQSANLDDTAWCRLSDHWRDRRVMFVYDWNSIFAECLH